MDLGLKGKTAIVTGASYGLGFSCAKVLAEEGVNVAICSRSSEEISKSAQDIETATSAKALPITADLTVPADLDRIIVETLTQFQAIDILVVSTGHPPTYSFTEATEEQWKEGYDLLISPALALCRLVLPAMRERKFGRIIFIGSIFGLEPEESSIIQSTFRTGLNAMAKCIATQFAPDGITVNVVCPGYFETPLVRKLAAKYADSERSTVEAVLEDWKSYSPAKRFGKPEDLGALVALLASPRGEFITGTAITIDGGAVRQY